MELEVIKETERETAEKLRKKTLSRDELMVRATDLIDLLHGRTTAKVFRARQDDPARLPDGPEVQAEIAAICEKDPAAHIIKMIMVDVDRIAAERAADALEVVP